MRIEEIRKINEANPFKPYTVRVSDGDGLPVPHPDFLFIPPVGGTVIVVDLQGCVTLVDANHITKLEFSAARAAKQSR
ncbi:MAG: hypothetical protein HZA92_03715 [Verrucomicrobia bacterium]|nr:hypothetical protein [Verrucomicrobiota bacterium]